MVVVGGNSYGWAQSTSTAPAPEALKVIHEAKPFYNKLEFPWEQEVAAAAFIRGNRLWVIFNKPQRFTFPSFADVNNNDWLKGGRQVYLSSNASYFVFELANYPEKKLYAKIDKSQNSWIIELQESAYQLTKEIVIERQPFASPVPRIEIQLDSEIAPIFMSDPYIGDQLIVIPLNSPKNAVARETGFIDFTVMQSIQGVAIALKSDLINSNLKRGRLALNASGLTISPPVTKNYEQSETKSPYLKSLERYTSDGTNILNLKLFKVADNDFNYHLYKLFAELNKAAPDLKGEIYAKIALFYLANELYTEASTIVKLIKAIDPDIASSYELQLLGGIAAFMNEDNLEAFVNIKNVDITTVPIKHRPEIRFWQSILGNNVTVPNDFILTQGIPYAYQHAGDNFLNEYNPRLFNQLGLNIIELFSKEKDAKALQAVASIVKAQKSLKGRQLNQYHYLMGLFYIGKNNSKMAKQEFNACANDIFDLYHRAACQFELLKLQLGKELPQAKAIEKLETLVLIWRGDELEGKMLEYLGDLYIKNNQYDRALYSWKRVVQRFPNTAQALLVTEKMSNTFVKFFLQKRDETLKPMEALALFYEFKELTPIGELGDEIILKFADYLIKLDLLDRATALLNHQVQNRLTSMKREIVINKLAKLHLLNHKPEVALQVLELGNDNMLLSQDASVDRKYIKAEVLIQLEDFDGALLLLKDDFSQIADDIKAEIFWQQQKWQDFNDFSEPYLYAIRNSVQMLSEDEVVRVLKQVISYIMLDRKDLLKEHAQAFYKRLPSTGIYENIARQLTQTALNNSSIKKGAIALESLEDLRNAANGLIQQIKKK